MSFLFLFLLQILADKKDSPPSTGTIGLAIPSWSLGSGNIFYNIILIVECVLFILFVLFPKDHLVGVQTQAIIFQGMLFAVDQVLSSISYGYGESLFFYIGLLIAPLAALLSVRDEFKSAFLSIVNSYGTTYLLALILRLKLAVCLIVGIVLYFIFLLFTVKSDLFQINLGKIYTVTLSIIVLFDIWPFFSIMKALHGATSSKFSLILSSCISISILLVVCGVVLFPAYINKLRKRGEEESV